MTETFEKQVEFYPSRDWRRDKPSRDYGISTMRIRFFLKGPKGAVQFMIGTEWGIDPVRKHLDQPAFAHHKYEFRKPDGWDLGYHSPKPMYEGQNPMEGECDVLGGTCYYDGSGLQADEMIEGFLAGGTDWLWPTLEQFYRHQFEGGEYPDLTPEYLPHPDDRTEAA